VLRITSPSLLPSSLLSVSLFLSSLPFLLSSSLSFIATAAAEEPLSPFFLFLSAPDAATQAAAELLLPCLFLPGLSLTDVAAAALEPPAAVEPLSPRIPISHSRHLTRLQLGLLLNHRGLMIATAPALSVAAADAEPAADPQAWAAAAAAVKPETIANT
jgi:hypothetical protein